MLLIEEFSLQLEENKEDLHFSKPLYRYGFFLSIYIVIICNF